ncbi:MAG: CHAT domain-containing tetratricopeptide repeat protein [Lapillicoccus sp.]
MLATTPGPYAASVAHQVIGIVERDAGRADLAIDALRTALRFARRSGDERRADVLATLGPTLAYAGRTVAGLRRLDEARPLTPAVGLPRLLLRRAHVLHLVGRYDEALVDLDAAISGSRRHGDSLWEARGLNNRCLVHLALGHTEAAGADARQAELLFDRLDQRLESAHALHNRGIVAHLAGDLPESLSLFEAVTLRYREIGVVPADLVIDRATTMLTAGLAAEARTMLEEVLDAVEVPPYKRAELSLTAARAHLAAGNPAAAEARAAEARRAFTRQRRPRWALLADLLSVQAAAGHLLETLDTAPTAALLRRSARLAESLRGAEAPEAPVALVIWGRLASLSGRPTEAEESLTLAAATRYRGTPLSRASAWLAAALLAEQRGDRRGLFLACGRGLDAVDEHRSTLGDIELRALASTHGLELARLALRESLRAGNTRKMLWWAERWRAAALGAPSEHPDDPDLDLDIAALRDVSRRLAAAEDAAGSPALARDRAHLESSVRRHYRRLRGSGIAAGATPGVVDLEGAQAALGETVLLCLVTIDRDLWAVTAAGGRVSRARVGTLETALNEAAYAGFSLRRAAHGRPLDLDALGGRVQAAVLGSRPRWGSAQRVLVIPPASLLSLPWGILPALAATSLTVAPSLTSWLKAHRQGSAPSGPVALVTGPGLTTDQQEVTRIADMHPRATVLNGADATVAGALRALNGAALAHVAAHGTYRADAPMFSSLTLADGPLTVHDLDSLSEPPQAMVLSACDSAGMSPIAADEALGLVSSLLAMGTRSVVASVAPVNDRATVIVMDHVHATFAAGGSLADGLRAARTASHEDPVVRATAGAFTAWGA